MRRGLCKFFMGMRKGCRTAVCRFEDCRLAVWKYLVKHWKIAISAVFLVACISGVLLYKSVVQGRVEPALAEDGQSAELASEEQVGEGKLGDGESGDGESGDGESGEEQTGGTDGAGVPRSEWDSRVCISSLGRNGLETLMADAGQEEAVDSSFANREDGSAGAQSSGNGTGTESAKSAGSTSGGSSGSTHSHNWVPVYTTIHHDYRYETIDSYNYLPETTFWAVYPPDVETCFYTFDRILEKFGTEEEAKAYCAQKFQETEQHYWYVKFEAGLEYINVLPSPQPLTHICGDAYDEEVLDHYECSICGAVK